MKVSYNNSGVGVELETSNEYGSNTIAENVKLKLSSGETITITFNVKADARINRKVTELEVKDVDGNVLEKGRHPIYYKC